MQNQAVIDIETYYNLRKTNESNENYIKELNARIKLLEKVINVVTIPQDHHNMSIANLRPPYVRRQDSGTLHLGIRKVQYGDIQEFKKVEITMID